MSLYSNLFVLFRLVCCAVKFGPASNCNFNLEPNVLEELFRVEKMIRESPWIAEAASRGDVHALGVNDSLPVVIALFSQSDLELPTISELQAGMRVCGQSGAGERYWCQADGCEEEGSGEYFLCSKVSSLLSFLILVSELTSTELTF